MRTLDEELAAPCLGAPLTVSEDSDFLLYECRNGHHYRVDLKPRPSPRRDLPLSQVERPTAPTVPEDAPSGRVFLRDGRRVLSRPVRVGLLALALLIPAAAGAQAPAPPVPLLCEGRTAALGAMLDQARIGEERLAIQIGQLTEQIRVLQAALAKKPPTPLPETKPVPTPPAKESK